MTRHRFRRLPVVSDDVLFGIVTATHIMRHLGNRGVFPRITAGDIAEIMGMPVRSLVSGALFTITPDKSLNDAARVMLEKNIGALPVIEGVRLIGHVTGFDLVRVFAQV